MNDRQILQKFAVAVDGFVKACNQLRDAVSISKSEVLDLAAALANGKTEEANEAIKNAMQVTAVAEPRDPHRGGSSYEATMLRHLLAVIHRDGGHYVEAHGLDKALADAETKILGWIKTPPEGPHEDVMMACDSVDRLQALLTSIQESGDAVPGVQPKFKRGDLVKKISGSNWEGRVVGEYSTALTLEGYAVESVHHPGSVQIYPAAALELVASSKTPNAKLTGPSENQGNTDEHH